MDFSHYLTKPLHKKIIAFFSEHPESVDSPRGVAAWVNAPREAVSRALEDLCRAGVLMAHPGPTTTGYSLTRDPQVLSKIRRSLED